VPELSLGWDQVRAWRLRRHHLDGRAPRAAMLDVVAGIAGLHAQVMSSAELTLWARVDGLEPDAVARALWEDRSLVKTWAMRGTLHLLPTAEFALWQAALHTTADRFVAPVWLRGFGVTRDELERFLDAVATALDGRVLSRDELAEEVARLTGDPALGEKVRGSWGAFLKPAAFRGHLCFGPSQGQLVAFTHPDGWLGHRPGPYGDRIYRPQGWLSPVLLIDGRMVGVWRSEAKGKALAVTVEPFVAVPAWARRAAEEEAERLAAFTGKALRLTWAS